MNFQTALDQAIELAPDDETRDKLIAVRDGGATTNDAGGPSGGGGTGDPDEPPKPPKVEEPID